MEIDITLEFYQKQAIYTSRITKHQSVIDIKKVSVSIVDNSTFAKSIKTKTCVCTITSTLGVNYDLSELMFQDKYTMPIGLKKSS